ncbi:hypothetical protein D3C80_781820 [compost metagenome]
MLLTEIARKEPQLILVFGRICSGKGTYCKSFPGYTQIVTSDIVRAVSKAQTRSAMQDTAHLDQEIAAGMVKAIQDVLDQGGKVVVDGIRQKSIVAAVKSAFPQVDTKLVWLDVPQDILRQRYADRADKKDDQTFDDAYSRDEKLGVADLEAEMRGDPSVEFVKHYK